MKSQLFAIMIFTIILSTTFVYGQVANYPFIIEPLSKEILQNLTDEFKTLNNDTICNPLDMFGFLKSKICQPSDIIRKEITNEDAIIEMAKDTIIKNSKFTRVTDKDSLIIERSFGLQGCIKCDDSEGDMKNIGWGIDFKNQIYNGIEVENTQIIVVADIEKVYRIDGHRYSDIEVPEPLVSENEAKNSLIGKELSYSDTTGNPITYKIIDVDLQNNAEKVILPTKSGSNIEIRLAWKIPIGKESVFWYVYVDAVTGNELKTQQMFQTEGPGDQVSPEEDQTTAGQASSGEENQTKGLNYLYIALGIIILAIILFFILRKRKK